MLSCSRISQNHWTRCTFQYRTVKQHIFTPFQKQSRLAECFHSCLRGFQYQYYYTSCNMAASPVIQTDLKLPIFRRLIVRHHPQNFISSQIFTKFQTPPCLHVTVLSSTRVAQNVLQYLLHFSQNQQERAAIFFLWLILNVLLATATQNKNTFSHTYRKWSKFHGTVMCILNTRLLMNSLWQRKNQ